MENNTKNPVFSYASLLFSVIAICFVVYLFKMHEPRDGMEGMFDGYQYLFGAAAALVVGFICTCIGFFRSEKLNFLLKINSVASAIFGLFVLFLITK